MRESNFSNPFQNKACVCISAAIYDRRALDCTATLPLINSLNHLAYLTSTSPRIREMVCLDGGLERLIRILRQVPRSPSQPPMRGVITKEMQAVWKWSLAFQCVVNIGVRGSETVRTRVVEAGMVPVAVRVLESYLRIADAIRDERKREARREEAKQRLERSAESGVPLLALGAEVATPTPATTTVARRAMREISETATPPQQPAHSGRPDQQQPQHLQHASPWRPAHSETVDVSMSNDATGPIATAAVDISDATQPDETRPTTPAEGIISNYIMSDSSSSAVPLGQGASAPSAVENEEDVASLIAPIDRLAEVDNGAVSPSSSSSSVVGARGRHGRGPADSRSTQERSAYSARSLNNVSSIEDLTTSGSGSDGADDVGAAGDDDSDSGNASSRHRAGGSSEVGMEEIEDRTTPRPPRRPLAPAAVAESTRASTASSGVTPSAMHEARSRPALPFTRPVAHARSDPVDTTATPTTSTHATRPLDQARTPRNAVMPAITAARAEAGHTGTATAPFGQRAHHIGSHGAVERTRPERERDSSSNQIHPSDMIYREEEVLLSLQLLAYLSKYAHVRTLFHRDLSTLNMLDPLEVLDGRIANSANSVSWSPNDPPKKNVFCIAERYTLRSSRTGLSHFASMGESRIAPEIQYWAGVIMRNACRKDEKQGGIRQCANMLCGKWEKQPREFAKCRRCRKAKYCSKQCQSKGWQMGHRFWCSARSDDEPGEGSKERVKDQPSGTTDAAHGQNALLTEDETQQTGGEDDIGTGGEIDAHPHNHDDHRHHHHHHHQHQGTTHATAHRAASADSGSRRLERSQQLQHSTQTSDHSDPTTSDAGGSGSAFLLTSDAEGDTTLRSRMMSENPQHRFGRSSQEDANAVGPSSRQQIATDMPSASGSSAHRGPGGGYGALARSAGPSGPSIGPGRRAVSAIPQHLQLPSSQHHGHFGDHHDSFSRSRTVSAASSSADISDMSEDEMERASRRVLASTVAPAQRSPAGTTLTLSAHAHPANDVTHHGDDLVRRRVLGNGEDSVAVGGVPTRTDLAGRPLPPPVIARHDGPGANMDMGMAPDADLLTLDGRLTPAVTDDADAGVFGRGDFDQMIWRGRTPSLEDNQQAAMLRRVPRIEVGSQHSLSTSTSREDLLRDSRGHGSRDATTDDEQHDAPLSASSSSVNVASSSSAATSASAYGTSPSMLNSALLLANQEDLGTPRFPSAGLHAPVARPAHRFASVNAASSAMSSSIAHSAAMSISGTPMTVSPANALPHQSYNHHQRGGLMHTFGDWRARVASPPVMTTSQPLSTQAANADGSSSQAYQGAGSSRSSTASSSSMLASAPATSSLSFGLMQQQPVQSAAQRASLSNADAEDEQFVVPNEIRNLFDEVEMQSTTRQRTPLFATSTAADMEVDT